MKERQLTAKQASFVNYFTDASNKKTYNNAVQSCLAAGYSPIYSNHRSSELVVNSGIETAISVINEQRRQETKITIKYIQAEHQRLAALAEQKGDIGTATRNKELLGKTVAAYTDNISQHGDGLSLNFTTVAPKPAPEAADKALGLPQDRRTASNSYWDGARQAKADED